MAFDGPARVTAVLGPTNTGKTHYAIERMLGHRTGVIGLPLRLLAREVYDRIVALRGPSVVALVTGEERIVPPRAAWWVCTVEAMPLDLMPEFLAIDEIQLCADPDRGHVFTQRLLNARGLSETLLLGAETMRGTIAHLVPGAQFLKRERYSKLTYTGARKISRMPARSAVVGFSTDDVYAIAELIRRQKGGAAVVMGALSPRTRNAQVELYQNGDVDYLVATDAIGMGLNLDIAHVAFSGVVKFDGRRHRHLAPNELAQIAGRAGRYTTDGTFGVTGDVSPLDPEVVDAIENSRFAPIRRLQWRNDRLDFGTPEALITSLEAPPDRPELIRAREADDLATLRALADLPAVRTRLVTAADMRLLWDVCQIPDYRKVAPAEHASLCARLFGFLHGGGGVPTDWLAGQVARIDLTDGDIDALSKRLAYIRTWTYVAQRRGWIDDADHWRGETRAVEDRLSDALHARLTQRFVDRRTSVLMRRLKQRESLVAKVTETGEVSIDDQFIGRLEGFRFRIDPSADPEQIPVLRTAAVAALAPVLSLRADRFYNAPDTEIDVTEQGGLMWGEHAVGRLAAGPDALSPQIQPFVDEDVAPEVVEKIRRRLGHWIDRRITALFQPLIALRDDEALTGMARGIAFRLVEALGVVPRAEMADDVKGLDQEGRASLRRHGVRFGQYTVFMPLMLKPAPTRLRLVLWSLKEGFETFPEAPPPGLVTVPAVPDAPAGYYPRAGYRRTGDRAIRIDMLERLADMIRPLDARAGFEAGADMLSITGLTHEQFAKLMQGLGYEFQTGTRPKTRPAKPAAADVAPKPDAAAEEAVEGEATAETPDAAEAVAATATEGEATAETPDAAEAVAATATEGAGETESQVVPAPTATERAVEAESVPEPEVTAESTGTVPAAEAEPAAVEAAAEAAKAVATDPAADAASETESEAATDPATAEVELETFYIFTRTPRRRPERGRRDDKPQGREQRAGGKPGGKPERRAGGPSQGPRGKGPGKGKGPKPENRREAPASARPPRHEKPIDPDNPFAALMALKTRT